MAVRFDLDGLSVPHTCSGCLRIQIGLVPRAGVEPARGCPQRFLIDRGMYAVIRQRSPLIQNGPFGGFIRSPPFALVRPNCCQTAVR